MKQPPGCAHLFRDHELEQCPQCAAFICCYDHADDCPLVPKVGGGDDDLRSTGRGPGKSHLSVPVVVHRLDD